MGPRESSAVLLLAIGAVLGSPGWLGAQCVVITPDDEIYCPYHPVPRNHDVAFLDLVEGATRTARLDRPNDPGSTVVLDPFVGLGWSPGPATVSLDGERLLVRRTKPSCPGWTGAPGPGLDCSYRRPTLWLAEHRVGDPVDPGDDPSVVVTREWGLIGGPIGRDITRIDVGVGPAAIVLLAFGDNAVAAAPIRRQPVRVRSAGRRAP